MVKKSLVVFFVVCVGIVLITRSPSHIVSLVGAQTPMLAPTGAPTPTPFPTLFPTPTPPVSSTTSTRRSTSSTSSSTTSILPTTSSTSLQPTTSSTTTTGLCLIKKIYGEDSAKTAVLQYFKDTVLSKTPEGRELIRLFYFWSPLIVKAIEEDEVFKEEIMGMLDTMLSETEEESE